jgi:hypothetical protein
MQTGFGIEKCLTEEGHFEKFTEAEPLWSLPGLLARC